MDNTTLPQSSYTPDEGEKPRQFIRIGNVKIDLGDAISAILQSAGTVLTDIRTVEFCQEVPAGELSAKFFYDPSGKYVDPYPGIDMELTPRHSPNSSPIALTRVEQTVWGPEQSNAIRVNIYGPSSRYLGYVEHAPEDVVSGNRSERATLVLNQGDEDFLA